ncbi:MAG: hypothetical protein AAGJ52_02895 [Pseudomonadota bacterium]
MESNNNAWIAEAGRRAVMLAALIVLVTLFWVSMLVYSSLSTLLLGAIALLSLLVLSMATAWAVVAIPSERGISTESSV